MSKPFGDATKPLVLGCEVVATGLGMVESGSWWCGKWQNYDRIFSGTTSKKTGASKKEAVQADAKVEMKSVKKGAAKKAAGKKKK